VIDELSVGADGLFGDREASGTRRYSSPFLPNKKPQSVDWGFFTGGSLTMPYFHDS
jgi:hypothetical protein